jgi:membrane protease YdiL (CAAX protease family)
MTGLHVSLVARGRLRVVLLLCGFALAVGVRVLAGGAGVRQSASAGVLFAALLVCLAVAARTRVPVTRRAVGIGIAGAVLLCLPVVLARSGPLQSTEGFASWALVVSVVAVAEEVFLRGTLYDAVGAVAGEGAAVVVGAGAFALLHVPLYGWHVVPLDIAVGLVLGELRRGAGSAAAPATAHVGADLAAWFLR